MHIRLSTVYLLVGVLLISTSENHARRLESEELECERDYCHNDNGYQYLELNYNRAAERNHLLALLKIMASGTIPIVATKAALVGLGFTSTGIIKGSFAAVWMSNLAMASGGGVAQGSYVAIMQALGAAGLGSVAVPLGIGGIIVGTAIIYREDLQALYNDAKFWQGRDNEIKQSGALEKIDLEETWHSGMQYLTDLKNAAFAGESLQHVQSRVMDAATTLADQANNKYNEIKPVIKERVGQYSDSAKDVFQRVKSEAVNQFKSKIADHDWRQKIKRFL